MLVALQAKLPGLSNEELARVSIELERDIYDLSRHTFGNYLVSRLATFEEFHRQLHRAIQGHVVDLLKHAQGSRRVPHATRPACIRNHSNRSFPISTSTLPSHF